MVIILVNFLMAMYAIFIHASAAAAARKSNLSGQNLTETGREHEGPFLNRQIHILS